MNVILLGMKHCGKSTLGEALAERWNCCFYDVDDLIEVAHECRTGVHTSVRDIFRELGDDGFEKLEALVVIELQKIVERSPGVPAVIAYGGRTALNPRTRHMSGHLGLRVYLKVDPRELFRRVQAGGLPPFLDPADPEGSFLTLFEQRRQSYETLADITVDLDGLGPDEALEKLENAIKEHADGR
jgi:shikimate kinase